MNLPILLRKLLATQLLGLGVLVTAQQPPLNPKALSATFSERLAFGKSMCVKNEHGSNIPFDVINDDIQGWGRFVMLNAETNADFIAEVTSYGSGSVTLGGTAPYSIPDGNPGPLTSAGKDLSSASVTLKIREAKTGREVWSGTEKVKSASRRRQKKTTSLQLRRNCSCASTTQLNRRNPK